MQNGLWRVCASDDDAITDMSFVDTFCSSMRSSPWRTCVKMASCRHTVHITTLTLRVISKQLVAILPSNNRKLNSVRLYGKAVNLSEISPS